jgi:hypothetical protein
MLLKIFFFWGEEQESVGQESTRLRTSMMSSERTLGRNPPSSLSSLGEEDMGSEAHRGWYPTGPSVGAAAAIAGGDDDNLSATTATRMPTQGRQQQQIHHGTTDDDEHDFVQSVQQLDYTFTKEAKRRKNASAQAAFRQRRQDYIKVSYFFRSFSKKNFN